MSTYKILNEKRSVVFGAGGSIGAAVARAFADAGAEVFLAGRTSSNVEEVAKQISAEGGRSHAAVIDALDDGAVNEYVDGIVKEAGGIDIVFNAVGPLVQDYWKRQECCRSVNRRIHGAGGNSLEVAVHYRACRRAAHGEATFWRDNFPDG